MVGNVVYLCLFVVKVSTSVSIEVSFASNDKSIHDLTECLSIGIQITAENISSTTPNTF